MVATEKELAQERARILQVCNSLGLQSFSDEEFMDALNAINNKPRNQFDFTKQSFADIQKKFNEYF